MKILSIARKTLLELWREPMLLVLLLFFPLLLLSFYATAFGQSSGGLAHFLKIYVLNQDRGPAGAALVAEIRAAGFEGQPVFEVTEVQSRAEADLPLRERKTALLAVIPEDFSRIEAGQPVTVELIGEVGADQFVFARSFLDDLVTGFANRAAGRPAVEPVGYAFVEGTGTMSDLQFGVPGIIVFGVMFMTIAAAQIMVRENVARTLRRLRLTRAGAFDLLIGVTLALAGAALLQIPITLISAGFLGFHSLGSLWLAALIVLLLAVAAVGLGLIVAGFVHSDSEAANVGATVSVLSALLSGGMYPLPAAPLFQMGGRTVQVYDLLPTAHATEALRRVMIFGDGPVEIAYSLVALTVLAVILMACGVLVYQRLQLQQG
jgi:ABC-2 type transport system permease protein